MIDYEKQLKLQSFLDGELSEADAQTVSAWITRDAEAAALLNELQQTTHALSGFEAEVKLPESREFYWSKIQRQLDPSESRERVFLGVPWSVRLKRLLMPVTGLAVLALLALVVTRENSGGSLETSAETAVEDSGAFTYHNYSAGATLVWLSYPAENEIADNDDVNSLD